MIWLLTTSIRVPFLLVVGLTLILRLTTQAAGQATFTVTNTQDFGDGVCDADCSLREAIGAANAGSGADTIDFDLPENSTITLYNGYTEMGQGLNTVLIQCAVEVTGIPAGRFQARIDSTYALDCAHRVTCQHVARPLSQIRPATLTGRSRTTRSTTLFAFECVPAGLLRE